MSVSAVGRLPNMTKLQQKVVCDEDSRDDILQQLTETYNQIITLQYQLNANAAHTYALIKQLRDIDKE